MRNVLIIGFVWPEPSSSAAGRRMLDIISFFKSDNYQVTFVSTAKKTDFSFDLASLGVKVAAIKLNCNSFDAFISALQPDIVVFDRYMTEEQFGWRVVKNCPDALRVLDTEDLHFLRKARKKAIEENGTLERVNLISDLTKREIASIYRCDLTLIISEYELNLLKTEFNIPEYLLVYFPLHSAIANDPVKKEMPSFAERVHFISIGNFRHPPNTDAVLQLKNVIWPRLKERLPDAEIHIYGAYCTEAIKSLTAKKERFIIKGRAESVAKIMRNAKAYLAPIRFGAGIKGKLLDAMEHGLPGITTSIGAEGMYAKLPWNGCIIDTADSFVEEAVKLYTNQDVWNKAVDNGYAICKTQFNKAISNTVLNEKLNTTINQLEALRAKNFIGAMLLHHSMRSTQYLSKYIELKNSTINKN